MAKYKVGDDVPVTRGKDTNMTLHITQVTVVTCSGGTQTFYKGRIWFDNYALGAVAGITRVYSLKETDWFETELG